MLILILLVLLCSPVMAADVWTYEADNALHVVWTSDGSDSYRVLITDANTGDQVSLVRTFDSTAKVSGLVRHQVYRVVVTGDFLVGEKFVCYDLASTSITIDQAQLNAAMSYAIPQSVAAGRVVVGVPGYWGFVELANTTTAVQRVTVHVGAYALPVVLQPGEAWATLADRVCPDAGQWSAWCDTPEGVVFRAGWERE